MSDVMLLTLSPLDPSFPACPLSPCHNTTQKMSLFYLHLSTKVIFLTFILPCYQFPLVAHGDPKIWEQNPSNYVVFLFGQRLNV